MARAHSGIPLVPADADADRRVLGVPDLEARIAGAEVVFLLIAGAIRNVALAIEPKDLAIRIGNDDAVVVARTVLLEDRDGDHHLQLARQLLQSEHARMLVGRVGGLEPFRVLLGAEIDALEQLGRQHDLRAGLRRLTHQRLGAGDVVLHVMAVPRLECGHGNGSVLHLTMVPAG